MADKRGKLGTARQQHGLDRRAATDPHRSWADRLVLLPDTRDQQPEVIPLGERTDESLDQLVGAVRTYTKTWGMAGRGMYWKPQLVLQVYPNADGRAERSANTVGRKRLGRKAAMNRVERMIRMLSRKRLTTDH